MRLMVGRVIHLIVIHCSATANGVSLARNGRSAAQTIDVWHGAPVRDKAGRIVREHMFERSAFWKERFNSHLKHIGYHYVIDVDGDEETGRAHDETGAHAAGHNLNSLGICVVGTDMFRRQQWDALRRRVNELLAEYPNARVCGHRDLSPDKDGDGVVERHEWLKICPGFDASTWWLLKNLEPMEGHIFQQQKESDR
jgi:N-acetyl-anhydromuramyl-L-alanine amidase AmpD